MGVWMTVGAVMNPAYFARLADPSAIGAFTGAVIQALGTLTAIVAGVIAGVVAGIAAVTPRRQRAAAITVNATATTGRDRTTPRVPEIYRGEPMTTAPTTVPATAPSKTPLLAAVFSYVALTIAYVVTNRNTPQPTASAAEVLQYGQTHPTAIMLGAVLLAAATAPLVWSAAVLQRRLRTAIPLIGGVSAGAALIASAVFGWLGASATGAARARDLADLAFMSGGVAFAVTFAVLIAGVTAAGMRTGTLPRAVTWTGLAIAVAGLLAVFTPMAAGFGYLLPVVRFGGLIWLVSVAFTVKSAGDRP